MSNNTFLDKYETRLKSGDPVLVISIRARTAAWAPVWGLPLGEGEIVDIDLAFDKIRYAKIRFADSNQYKWVHVNRIIHKNNSHLHVLDILTNKEYHYEDTFLG